VIAPVIMAAIIIMVIGRSIVIAETAVIAIMR
jgi:hypothetical protein